MAPEINPSVTLCVKITVFRDVMSCSYVEEHKMFGRSCYLHLQCSRLRKKPELYSETSVHIYQTIRRSVSEEIIPTNSLLDKQPDGTCLFRKNPRTIPILVLYYSFLRGHGATSVRIRFLTCSGLIFKGRYI